MNSILRYLLAPFVVSILFFTFVTAQAQTSLNALLTPYLSQYNLPALAAAVVKGGRIIAAGAVGTRRVGSNIPVTLNDRFHLGSDTKAMTALLAAMLVEEGKLRWNTTIREVFPELAEKMDPALRGVTLEQLLSHTSGIPTDNEDIFKLYSEAMSQEGNLDEMRYWLVQQWSKRPLEFPSGNKIRLFEYGIYIRRGHDRTDWGKDLGRDDNRPNLRPFEASNRRSRATGLTRQNRCASRACLDQWKGEGLSRRSQW